MHATGSPHWCGARQLGHSASFTPAGFPPQWKSWARCKCMFTMESISLLHRSPASSKLEAKRDRHSFSLSLISFTSLEKEMATHSSVLAWRIPGTEETGGLLSMGSHRVGHDWCDLAAAAFTSSAFPFQTARSAGFRLSRRFNGNTFCICDNRDGPGEYYAKQKKSQRKSNIVWSHLYVES